MLIGQAVQYMSTYPNSMRNAARPTTMAAGCQSRTGSADVAVPGSKKYAAMLATSAVV